MIPHLLRLVNERDEILLSNRKMGNSFESEFCQKLFEYGFWVHNMAQNQAGQPADVIAVVEGQAFLIDCKVCANGRFPLTRIEENQEQAMKLWQSCGNGCGYFALKVDNGIFMISKSTIDELRYNGKKSLDRDDIATYSDSLDEWATRVVGRWK